MILWRISNHLSLTGEGALRASGRWHTRGRRIVYCAENPATVLLEVLVHFEIEIRDLPARYRLLKIDVPKELRLDHVSVDDLPQDWPERVDQTRGIGDAWLATASTAMLRVPSVLVPETFTVLLNPAHPDAAHVVGTRRDCRRDRARDRPATIDVTICSIRNPASPINASMVLQVASAMDNIVRTDQGRVAPTEEGSLEARHRFRTIESSERRHCRRL